MRNLPNEEDKGGLNTLRGGRPMLLKKRLQVFPKYPKIEGLK